jgi:hypothetical protein
MSELNCQAARAAPRGAPRVWSIAATALVLACPAPDSDGSAPSAEIPASTAAGAVQPADTTGALAGYALDASGGERFELPARLAEISGLAVAPGGRVFTHGDEAAIVYEVDPHAGTVVKRFYVGDERLRGDFEGLAIAGSRFFLVTSRGTIVEFAEGQADEHVSYETYETPVRDQCEVEGLEFDPTTNALLLACKTNLSPQTRGNVVIFAWSVERKALEATPRFSIPQDFLARAGRKTDLHASGIAVHPRTGTIILVAAQEELLVEIAPGGKVLNVRELPSKRHPQAEGIAFLSDGTMLVSDERRNGGLLTLYPLRTTPTRE